MQSSLRRQSFIHFMLCLQTERTLIKWQHLSGGDTENLFCSPISPGLSRGKDHLSQPAANALPNTPQHTVGLFWCTLLALSQLGVHLGRTPRPFSAKQLSSHSAHSVYGCMGCCSPVAGNVYLSLWNFMRVLSAISSGC